MGQVKELFAELMGAIAVENTAEYITKDQLSRMVNLQVEFVAAEEYVRVSQDGSEYSGVTFEFEVRGRRLKVDFADTYKDEEQTKLSNASRKRQAYANVIAKVAQAGGKVIGHFEQGSFKKGEQSITYYSIALDGVVE